MIRTTVPPYNSPGILTSEDPKITNVLTSPRRPKALWFPVFEHNHPPTPLPHPPSPHLPSLTLSVPLLLCLSASRPYFRPLGFRTRQTAPSPRKTLRYWSCLCPDPCTPPTLAPGCSLALPTAAGSPLLPGEGALCLDLLEGVLAGFGVGGEGRRKEEGRDKTGRVLEKEK